MKKLITIIGAGKGISQSIAKKFGNEGFKIALIARNESNLQELVMQLSKLGIDATYACLLYTSRCVYETATN